MKLLIVSDSHGRTAKIHEILAEGAYDALIHLGDEYGDFLELKDCYDMPMFGVKGNVDIYQEGPELEIVRLEGLNILLCHGHRFNVKNTYELLKEKAKALKVDIALFGHSHIPYIDEDGFLLMNPGSISKPKINQKPSYGILTLENQGYTYEIKYLHR